MGLASRVQMTQLEQKLPGNCRIVRRIGGRGGGVYLADYNGVEVVVKYRPGKKASMSNELFCYGLRELDDMIPKLYDHSEDLLFIEYLKGYRHVSSCFGLAGMLPIRIVRRVVRAVDILNSNGCSPLDLNYGNVMVGPDGSVKLIDFENLYRYSYGSEDLDQSPFAIGQEYFRLRGIDYQAGKEFPHYNRDWFSRCGVAIDSILTDHHMKSVLHKAVYFVPLVANKIIARATSVAI